MIRRSAVLLAVLLAAHWAWGAPAPANAAANLAPPVFNADYGEFDFDGNYSGKGNVHYRQEAMVLVADELHYDHATNTIIATGHVALTFRDQRLLADYFEYHRTQGTFLAKDIRIGRYPVYIQGDSAEGHVTEITIHNAVVSYTDPGRWKPSIKAKTIIYSPGHYVRTVKSLVGLGGAGLLPIGSLSQSLNQAVSAQILTFDVGYRSSLGGILDVGFHEPVFNEGVHLGADVGWYTWRGLMMGPSGSYADPDGSGDWQGFLHSGWIDDRGKKYTDIMGDAIPDDRDFITWHHQQTIDDTWTIDGDINYWSDSSVTRDFRPKEFYLVQSPDNFFEVDNTGENDIATMFARFRPNNFEDVQERLPEVSYNLMPIAIGDGFYERGSASAVVLQERPPQGGTDLSEDRLDVFYGITRPIAPNDWFDFTPVVGGRLTEYLDTQGAMVNGNYLRSLGEIGFDSQVRSSGTFDYQNATWDIDGLRHLFTPEISYRYIPGSGAGEQYIPNIDRQTFSTYLNPLELGDARSIDDLSTMNTLRVGAENILQTRDRGYGSTNLIDWNLADDINFHRTLHEPDVSDLHSELELTPAKWIEFDMANIVSTQTYTLRECDTGINLHDGNTWELRLAADFLRHEDDDYSLTYSERINEQFTALLLGEYGARQHILNQVSIGCEQTIANTWRLRWLVTRNGGPNREGRWEFNVEPEVLRF